MAMSAKRRSAFAVYQQMEKEREQKKANITEKVNSLAWPRPVLKYFSVNYKRCMAYYTSAGYWNYKWRQSSKQQGWKIEET